MNPLSTERLILRNWREGDRDLFHFINSDDRVMEFFPMRRTREQSDELMDLLAAGIEKNGFGFAVIEIAETGQTAGFAGLHLCDGIPGLEPGEVEIGWRLAPQFWGRGIASEASRRWLEFGFDDLGLDRIVSFAVDGNDRSTAVMRRIGMRARPGSDFDHPKVPDTHPRLKRHVFYELTAKDWRAARD
ncbi:MAG: GNAT family N-acetyltransferase [Rhizobiales bacterium]|nr:GNAT family N-acetyltransferase [Hyphomicrobiales bacterium]|tara:strand:- start:143 stop:706 length:564 start_codon:yes stop_codon:yes gene_type:complete